MQKGIDAGTLLCCAVPLVIMAFGVIIILIALGRQPSPPDVKFTGSVDGIPIQYAGYDSQPSVVFSIDQGDEKALRGLMRERVEVEVRKVDD